MTPLRQDKISSFDWDLIAPHLDYALELDAVACDRWLTKLSLTHPDVAETVGELLKEREQLDEKRFLLDPLPLPSGIASLEGKRVGAYTIERLIERGGMGEVWLASRSDGRFEGKFAMKFIDRSMTQAKLQERFRREGRVLARLSHPHIARLLDAGTTEEGRHYLVLEYIDGERIDRYCEQRSLNVDERVRLFLGVVSAVAHAHSNLIIHRDLKPSNVLVTQTGVVKLLDFGIAKLVADDVEDFSRTKHDEAVLTPDYAAPEQLLGQPPSTATDVYQLGMLLYVLLTGQHPVGDDLNRAQRMEATLQGDLPLASERVAGARRKALRGDLDAILAMTLRRESSQRYATAAALREDLFRYLDAEPVVARRGAAFYRTRKFVRRHWASVIAACVVLITLVGAITVTRLQLVETRKQRETALANERRAEAAKDFLQLVLSEFQSRGEPLTARKLLERSSALLKAQYANQPAFLSEMLIYFSEEYGPLMEYKGAIDLLVDARAMAEAQHNDTLLAAANCELGHFRARIASYDEARKDLSSGLQALARSAAPVEIRARCLCSQAELYSATGDHEKAIETAQNARTSLERADATHGTMYNDILSRLATDLVFAGRVSAALPVFRQSVDAHIRNGRGGTRFEYIAQQNVASALYRLGEVSEAYLVNKRLFEQLLKLNSVDDVSISFVVNTATTTERMLLDDAAIDMLPAAIDRAEREADFTFLRGASLNLARAKMTRGFPRDEVEKSLQHLEEVRIQGKSALSPAAQIEIEGLRADLDLREGKPDSANRRVTQLLAKLNESKFDASRSTYFVHSLAARTELANGNAANAKEHARQALKIAEPIARGADTSADVGEALLLLARATLAEDRSTEALPILQRAVRCLTNGYGVNHPATREATNLQRSINVEHFTTKRKPPNISASA